MDSLHIIFVFLPALQTKLIHDKTLSLVHVLLLNQKSEIRNKTKHDDEL